MSLRPADAPRWRIGVIDGPNMPNLGARDRDLYGPIGSLAELQAFVAGVAAEIGVAVTTFASNFEGEILEFIHGSAADTDGYLINPAGLTTYGEATRHALADTCRPYVEVHFSNLPVHLARVAPGAGLSSRFTHSAAGVSMGLRHHSYAGALVALALALDDPAFLRPDVQPD
jgi:3-dehydroquinate dehydratase II